MNRLTAAVLFVLVGLSVAQLECKIKVRVRNDGHSQVRVDLIVPSLNLMSDPVILTEWKQEKSVEIKGKNCEAKPWTFHIYTWENEEWKLKKKVSSKFTGNGWFLTTVDVDDKVNFNILDRHGIMCSEGFCGK
ncbi:unnamed protein product [Caenorhabditis angaria]|uniref:Uncharacterized protein n=1 Tax=Caenorhabditis angaria TaxID=860376 RepID=A0A9P1J3P1_9PELO|nr:unnamed protein product [Caenorhabditis angaria]